MKLAPSDSFIFLTSRFIDPTELKHSLENYFFDNGLRVFTCPDLTKPIPEYEPSNPAHMLLCTEYASDSGYVMSPFNYMLEIASVKKSGVSEKTILDIVMLVSQLFETEALVKDQSDPDHLIWLYVKPNGEVFTVLITNKNR
jgi:hypothetical protein